MVPGKGLLRCSAFGTTSLFSSVVHRSSRAKQGLLPQSSSNSKSIVDTWMTPRCRPIHPREDATQGSRCASTISIPDATEAPARSSRLHSRFGLHNPWTESTKETVEDKPNYDNNNSNNVRAATADDTTSTSPQRAPSFRLHNQQLNETAEQQESRLRYLCDNRPNQIRVEDYITVLRALSISSLPDAARRAERWLQQLEQQQKQSSSAALPMQDANKSQPNVNGPTVECYQLVIQAWGQAAHEDPAVAIIRAERWLRKYWVEQETPLADTNLTKTTGPFTYLSPLHPNTSTFNAFLDVCSKGRALKGSNRLQRRGRDLVRDHAQKAQNILEQMIDHASRVKQQHHNSFGPFSATHASVMSPNTDSFNFVIRAWTRCRHSVDVAERAMRVLQCMEDYHAKIDPSVRPNDRTYAMVMDAIAIRAKLKVKQCRHYNALQDSSQNGMLEIKLLRDILQHHHTTHPMVQPSAAAYNALIATWSHLAVIHPQAPLEAEKVLRTMVGSHSLNHRVATTGNHIVPPQPDAISYLMVMRAWLNGGSAGHHADNSAHRVAWWLQQQWKDHEFEGQRRMALQPTTETFNTVMRAWANDGKPLRAEEVLSELIEKSNQDLPSATSLQPNSESFALVIRAWLVVAERGSDQALRNAVRWMDTLLEQEQDGNSTLTSSVDLFSSILAAARKCASHSPDVLDLAIDVFDKLRASHHNVDFLHYSRLLQVSLLALSRPENNDVREAFVRQLIHECQDDGLVSSSLLKALVNGPVYYSGWTIESSARLVDDLFPDWLFPASWTRNIKQKDNLPKRIDLKRIMNTVSVHGSDPYP